MGLRDFDFQSHPTEKGGNQLIVEQWWYDTPIYIRHYVTMTFLYNYDTMPVYIFV